MNITQLTVSFKRTQSLPGYCNVSSGLTATADVPAGEDHLVVEQRLRNELEQAVNEWIDDALEEAGQPARYRADSRYDLLWWRNAKLAIIAPHILPLQQGDTLLSLPGDWGFHSGADDACYTNQRLTNLQRMAREIGLSHIRAFSTIEDVRTWAHSYLSLDGLWSIVGVYYILDTTSEWEYLGRIAIPGEIYARLITDPTLKAEPVSMTGSVGIRLPDLAEFSIPILKTAEDALLWLQKQILEAHPPDDDDVSLEE